MWSNILDRISFVSLSLVVILLPVFFLPLTRIPVETSKGLLLVVGLAVSVMFWAVARFSDGRISFPRSPILLAGVGVLLVIFLSALFSSSQAVSMFGTIFDLGTFWFMFAAVLLMVVSSLMVRDGRTAQTFLFGVIISSTVVMVFQIFRFMFPEMLSLGVLGGKIDNLVGSWNSLGILAGFSCLTSLFVIEFFSITRMAKVVFSLFILVSLFTIAAVNYTLVWKLVGIFALLIFVYKISSLGRAPQEEGKDRFPAFSFAVVMIALLFFMSGQFIGSYLPNKLSLINAEVSPSLSSTFEVTKEALKKDPLLGTGPNRFSELWAMYRPTSINNSIFWNVSFNSGSGVLPTFLATTGYLGVLSWFLFIFVFLSAGVKLILSGIRQNMHREMVALFILALYLFLAAFFYSVGPVSFLFAFAFTGMFVGLMSNRENGEISVSFMNEQKKSFFFVLCLVVVMVISAAMAFKYVERFASVSYFGSAVQSESISEAESSIVKALSLHSNDLYMRTYTQVYLLKLNSLLNKEANALSEEDKADIQSSFTQALSGALGATTYNKSNYLNFQTLGNVYSTAGALGVKDAFTKAVEAYQTAETLNPQNPSTPLSIARAYFADGKLKEAKDLANKALTLKGNYIDALIMLSQIARREGNSGSALSYAEQALSISPSDQNLIDYVSSLKGGN